MIFGHIRFGKYLLTSRHVYWLILVFVLYYVGKWLWAYITPKYEEVEETEEGKKKEKKEKIKYIKQK